MSFVYRPVSADQYVSANYGFLRIKQALASAGDIFESVQGAHSFCLGPDSDISLATIAYVDPFAQPTFSAQATPEQTYMNTLTISPQRPWTQPIPAVNKEGNYAPAGTPGRILIWPTELYDGTYLPPGFNDLTDGLIRESPILDVIQSFGPTPAIVPQRADKTYQYETLPFKASRICYLLIPYYGRRYASLAFHNLAAGKLNIQISGINFVMTDVTPPLYALQTLNDNAGNGGAVTNARSVMIGTGFNWQLQYTYDVSNVAPPAITTLPYQGGMFDYLLIEVAQGDGAVATGAAVRIVVSDVVGRTGL